MLAAVLLLCAGACGRGEKEVYPGAPVVLVSIDTLRSDRLPAYGYTGVETPAIDAFRRDAILFERAYSHYPLTLPSHASILTGLLPGEHGVRDNVGYRLASDELPYLPRELKAAGYATGAAVSAFVLQGALGLAESFDLYEDDIEGKRDTPLGGLQRPGRETLEAALPWLERVAGGPFFFFLHLYEPHSPYRPSEPHASRWRDPYDGEVAEADAIVGRLFAELTRRGLYDRAIIVLLSDHGEGLGDHGEEEHGIFLYREALAVPLLL
jgi:arylsulfatase A-like enzyme